MNPLDLLDKRAFAGKTVFVTGGGSGINLGIARTFAALGAKLAICGRNAERLDGAAIGLRELGAEVLPVVADVRDYQALEQAVQRTADEVGLIDVLVCGAAGNFLSRAENLSSNGFRTVIEIDLIGSFNAARAAFAQLQQTRGSVLFISAGQSYMPHAFQVHAGAAKAGIDQMMSNLALEWGRFGIRVNSIVPGPIDGTEGLARLATPAQHRTLIESIPLRRFGRVEEMGHAAAFLASPLAAYITGARLVCDGGQNLGGSGLMNMAIDTILPAGGAQ
ncbi:MAG: SDR family oxidoreductase [Pseudomonadota bacterium]